MYTIDPTKITNYKRETEELEKFLIFCACVAGKNSQRTARAIEILLGDETGSPFLRIKKMVKKNTLIEGLRKSGIGQYSRLSKCLEEMANSGFDLRKVTVEELESIHGIGPKTSRFFILHSRRNQKIAVLDTHILKYMSKLGYTVPKSTPSGKRYKELEQEFLLLAKESKMSPAELDLKIWKLGNSGELR